MGIFSISALSAQTGIKGALFPEHGQLPVYHKIFGEFQLLVFDHYCFQLSKPFIPKRYTVNNKDAK